MTGFIGVYMIASPVFAWLADTGRMEKKKIIYISLGIWIGCTMMSAMTRRYWEFMMVRAMVGIGEAGYSTISLVLLAEYFGEEKRNRVIGVYQLAIPIGAGIGFLFGAFFSSLFGWRSTFLLSSLLSSSSLFFLFFLPSPPPLSPLPSHPPPPSHHLHHHQEAVKEGEGEEGSNWEAVKEGEGEEGSNWEAVKKVMGNGEWMMGAMGVTGVSFVAGGLADWFPTYLVREKGMDIQSAAMICSASVILGGILGTIAGSLSVELLSRLFPSSPLPSSQPSSFPSSHSSSHPSSPSSTYRTFGLEERGSSGQPSGQWSREGMNKWKKSFIVGGVREGGGRGDGSGIPGVSLVLQRADHHLVSRVDTTII